MLPRPNSMAAAFILFVYRDRSFKLEKERTLISINKWRETRPCTREGDMSFGWQANV